MQSILKEVLKKAGIDEEPKELLGRKIYFERVYKSVNKTGDSAAFLSTIEEIRFDGDFLVFRTTKKGIISWDSEGGWAYDGRFSGEVELYAEDGEAGS